MRTLTVVDYPDTLAVSVEEMRYEKKIDIDTPEENAFVTKLIKAATEYCEGHTHSFYQPTTCRLWIDRAELYSVCPYRFYFDTDPVTAVSAFKYYDAAGTLQTLSANEYEFLQHTPRPCVYVASLPNIGNKQQPIYIDCTCGYAAGTLPNKALQAMALLVGHWHLNRETILVGSISSQLKYTVDDILDQITYRG